MTDILDREPPFEGQRGYKGPAILADLIHPPVKYDRDADE